MRIFRGLSFDGWWTEMTHILGYPLGDGFMNHLALVCVLVSSMVVIAAVCSKFGLGDE